jgi:hypothetical protein
LKGGVEVHERRILGICTKYPGRLYRVGPYDPAKAKDERERKQAIGFQPEMDVKDSEAPGTTEAENSVR